MKRHEAGAGLRKTEISNKTELNATLQMLCYADKKWLKFSFNRWKNEAVTK